MHKKCAPGIIRPAYHVCPIYCLKEAETVGSKMYSVPVRDEKIFSVIIVEHRDYAIRWWNGMRKFSTSLWDCRNEFSSFYDESSQFLQAKALKTSTLLFSFMIWNIWNIFSPTWRPMKEILTPEIFSKLKVKKGLSAATANSKFLPSLFLPSAQMFRWTEREQETKMALLRFLTERVLRKAI